MKKILYISNIEVPYKARFFNELSRQVHLTVLYERSLSSNRDEKWAKSIEADYEKYYLEGVRIGNERAFSTKILGYLKRDYDEIIIGCVNSPVQIFAMLYMKLMGIKYSVNFDGEMFFNSSGIKKTLKVMLLRGADKYYAAGEKSADVYKSLFGERIYPYYFSSLSKEEVDRNASCDTKREKYVLVVGQYFEYKGLDLAVQVARKNRSMQFVFVGMGKRTDKFIEELNVHDKNIKIIPFLQRSS